MAWRVAESLIVLRDQVNRMAPKRSKSSDGSIGDAKHASRSSDHNPWVKDGATGVVTAIDITHSPNGGMDSEKLAQALIDARDNRIKYIISNRRICSGSDGPSPWRWRPYSGSNPHNKHVHISVKSDKKFYDDETMWDLSALPPQAVAKPVAKSKIAQGAGTVATAETVDLATQVHGAIDTASQVKDTADGLGILESVKATLSQLIVNPRFWIAVIVILVALAIIYWRWRDHGRGS